ncbi:hypothetical protein KKF84_13010, partial [Myxococcota bacterium]|nr:hypothetical protein [Myxococcota bacterium]
MRFPDDACFLRQIPFVVDAEGDVTVTIPAPEATSFWQRLLPAPPEKINLDPMGSAIWHLCQGTTPFLSMLGALEEK